MHTSERCFAEDIIGCIIKCCSDAITHEILSSIKRAGADIIITYFARRAAEKMAGKR